MQLKLTGRTIEGGVERKYPTVSSDQPIPIRPRVSGDTNNRLIQVKSPSRTIKPCVAKTEDATITTNKPITGSSSLRWG
jgi:hypothetical protein